jgi:uncharacterized protein YjbJ (UPF0337 family)
MKPSTQDQTEGKLHEVKGKIQEEIGKITKTPTWKAKERRTYSWQSSKVGRQG